MDNWMIYVAIWWTLGAAGCLYEWTRDADFTVGDVVFVVVFGGLVGPLWFLLYGFHFLLCRFGGWSRVLIRQRRQN